MSHLVHPSGILSPKPDRRIEIVGESFGCGYAVEGKDTKCSFSPETQNHDYSTQPPSGTPW